MLADLLRRRLLRLAMSAIGRLDVASARDVLRPRARRGPSRGGRLAVAARPLVRVRAPAGPTPTAAPRAPLAGPGGARSHQARSVGTAKRHAAARRSARPAGATAAWPEDFAGPRPPNAGAPSSGSRGNTRTSEMMTPAILNRPGARWQCSVLPLGLRPRLVHVEDEPSRRRASRSKRGAAVHRTRGRRDWVCERSAPLPALSELRCQVSIARRSIDISMRNAAADDLDAWTMA